MLETLDIFGKCDSITSIWWLHDPSSTLLLPWRKVVWQALMLSDMKEIRKPIVENNLVASHSHIHVQGPLVYISLLLLSRFKIQSWDHTKSAKHILKLHMALQSLSETAFIQTWSLSHCCSVSSNSQSSVQKKTLRWLLQHMQTSDWSSPCSYLDKSKCFQKSKVHNIHKVASNFVCQQWCLWCPFHPFGMPFVLSNIFTVSIQGEASLVHVRTTIKNISNCMKVTSSIMFNPRSKNPAQNKAQSQSWPLQAWYLRLVGLRRSQDGIAVNNLHGCSGTTDSTADQQK